MPPVTSRLPSQRRVHIRLLAERFARAQLWAVARMSGHRDGVPAVLFIDTHDSGRARMAKALFITRAGSGGLAGGHDVPVPDAARHVVWDVPDPREHTREELCGIRDQLAALVDDLATRLGIPEPD